MCPYVHQQNEHYEKLKYIKLTEEVDQFKKVNEEVNINITEKILKIDRYKKNIDDL